VYIPAPAIEGVKMLPESPPPVEVHVPLGGVAPTLRLMGGALRQTDASGPASMAVGFTTVMVALAALVQPVVGLV